MPLSTMKRWPYQNGEHLSGTPRLHVEKVLNHTIDDVAEIFDRHDYSEEKRVALKALSERLESILRRRIWGVAPARFMARVTTGAG